MKQVLDISVPCSWRELDDTQLRFLYGLLSKGKSLSQIKCSCLLKWGKIQVLRRIGGVFVVLHKGIEYPISAVQVAECLAALDWIGEIPSYPVRISRIGTRKAVRADIQDISFGDYISLENLYQGYLQTHNDSLLQEMGLVLYRAKNLKLSSVEMVGVFYWFSAVKRMMAGMFRHFYKAVDNTAEASLPSREQLVSAMNSQIRALTGGDITKERLVLDMDCWRALVELDAKAKDYDEIKKAYHK